MNERLLSMEAEFLKALAHPTRIRIIKHLMNSERCVCEFTEDLDVEQSNMSQHLAILRKQGIVSSRKDGMKVMYKVNHPQIFEILQLIEEVLVSQVKETLSILNKEKRMEDENGY
ncbi:metalloregulator ArsR/SmtB family transcription factor [Pelotomaculum isophthalicicum JI]|uniref:Metalloregulator ArsR/SmtB family transcription factor n=1 Tax=Pelotomaculum isophthalicicum JI TaxID=947010 RepID=A0A9X4H705_9FIRM|nr:metalloregulator ArsR/SmtB family transcription factor [Pelotomaculum isophthalicicum]MDF9409692.1 metalloregulator ArsR/SmtB family transcription factor [Pelotomaculum isophthalicicum JI]